MSKEIGSLESILSKPEKYLDTVVWVPTIQMLEVAHPENPRTHSEDGDVAEIFKSLLAFGWGDFGVTFNPHTGKQTGGHGRVLAAKLGTQHDDDWFEQAWELFLKGHKDRAQVAQFHQERYCPSYWQHVPVIITNLIETDQKSLMVRLNNTQPDGQDDPARMAAILGQLGKAEQELAGWDPVSAKAFTAAFLVKAEEIEEELAEEESGYNYDAGLPGTDATDREYGQTFERDDAVDYGDDSGDPWAVTAEEESGETTITTAEGTTAQIAQVDTSGVDDAQKATGVYYDSDQRETRAVLLFSKDQLSDFKDLFGTGARIGPLPFILEKLGHQVDTTRSIKEWRPDCCLAILNAFIEQNQSLFQEWMHADQQSTTAEEASASPEESE
ncbi:hypothetical protein D0962_22900 [Leptolyngbyaceae cyanobacterium CCMR0082]|uniref:Uncharacterized protein n=1 Tax=Adonisia turfae CCMR0082 TaxID=2304604 RepID=A0A6M0SAN4_9CYAN|nr:hypothetical protein [Adonisia turfae]NEZ65569.1 hypothetical protein [Adonisia turfae CCMR0082]